MTMPPGAMKHLLVRPAVPAPLDPNFSPVILAKRQYLKAVAQASGAWDGILGTILKGSFTYLEWALPRADGCARYKLPVFPEGHEDIDASIYLAGTLGADQTPIRVTSMPNVCGTPDSPFEVKIVSEAELPEAKDTPQVCGKSANGCRLAFDLGKSDIKTVAVKDEEVVYSKETEWDVTNPDPDYHFKAVTAALKLAKEKLPKVDAVGGSATGTLGANNEATWCDIFPNVPPAVYKQKVVDIFQRIAKDVAGDVPLKVINDGEARRGSPRPRRNIMGISMGSSEGAGYANAQGNLMGWINELCYGAHTGMSHMYLGQRGATKLAAKAGVKVPANYVYPHPEMCTIKHENHAQCLKLIQKAMEDPAVRPQAVQLYVTMGVYLGYALAQPLGEDSFAFGRRR
eukprot:g20437.t1